MAQIKFPDMDPIEVDDGYIGWWAAVNANGEVWYHQKEPDDTDVSWKNQLSTGLLIMIPHEYLRQHNWRNLRVRVTHEVKIGYWGYGNCVDDRRFVACVDGPNSDTPIVGAVPTRRGWWAASFSIDAFDGWTYRGETKPEGW